MNVNEAMAAFAADRAKLLAQGVSWAAGVEPRAYVPAGFGSDFNLFIGMGMDALGMDAQPPLSTTANSGVPMMLTTLIDPAVYRILFTPNKAAQIYGEVRKGTWIDDTAMFPTVEHTGEVTSYNDFAESGHTGANTNWPQRQSYLFQTMKEYGERELDRAGLAKINWVSEIDQAAATVLNKFSNLTYFFGVQGLQNFGALNDPNLSASLTPATKGYGGTRWIVGGVVQATANEIYTDIQSTFSQLVAQTNGLLEAGDELVLAMGPQTAVALTTTNSFNVNVHDLLKKNFPRLKVEVAVQYQQTSTSNPQGLAAGNLMQLFAPRLEGQETIYCAFNEKMRSHPIIRFTSSFRQKETGGTWGAIIRMPVAIASMIGL